MKPATTAPLSVGGQIRLPFHSPFDRISLRLCTERLGAHSDIKRRKRFIFRPLLPMKWCRRGHRLVTKEAVRRPAEGFEDRLECVQRFVLNVSRHAVRDALFAITHPPESMRHFKWFLGLRSPALGNWSWDKVDLLPTRTTLSYVFRTPLERSFALSSG